MTDLSVSGRIWRGDRLEQGVLFIEDGRIQKVARSGNADEHLDFGTKAILPGGIDLHVHFRDPGATHKEDWETGTTAAAFGGVTTVVDMPNTLPPTTTVKAAEEKLAKAARHAVVDHGIWAGATWYTGELERLLELCMGVKVYLGATTGDLLLDERDAFRETLEVAGRMGKPVVLHAEAERVLGQNRRTEQAIVDHDTCRPPLAEVEAIYDTMKLLPGIKQPPAIHVAHTASIEAVQAAEAARFSRGVCPHHLLLHHGMEFVPEARGKMNPPLRSEQAMLKLREAFVAGRLPIVESDHAPHTRGEKDGPFHSAPAGVPGVETMIPLLLARAKEGGLDLGRVVDACTSGPADLLGIDRGRLEPGMYADFAVYDLDAPRPVAAEDLHSKCNWTPYEGMPAIFPEHVYLRGEPLVTDDQRVAKPGSGKRLE